MNCEEAKRHWHERFDGALPDDGFEEHVRRCDACRRYVTEMGLITQSLDELRRDTEAIVSRVRDDADTWRIRRASVRTGWLRAAGGIAAMIAVTIAAWAYLSPTTRPLQSDTPVAKINDSSPTPLGITLRGQSARRFLAVAEATGDANVQLFHLYPVLASAEPATSR